MPDTYVPVYYATPDYCANLGLPITNPTAATKSNPWGTEGSYQEYQYGRIYNHTRDGAYQVYAVPKGIVGVHNSVENTEGPFGFPVGSPIYAGNLGQCQQFEGGEAYPYAAAYEYCSSASNFKYTGGLNNYFLTDLRGDSNYQDWKLNKINTVKNQNDTLTYGSYNGTSDVWLIIHGWNGSIFEPDFTKMANVIKDKKPNDYVLSLQWGGAEATLVSSTDQWIRPTAELVKAKLNQWGFTDGTKLNIVGHSMGSIMSAEVSRAIGSNSNLFLLEPPAELPNKYRVDERVGSTSNEFETFNGTGGFSRSFKSADSVAASDERAATADEYIVIEYYGANLTSSGDQHGWVKTTFSNIVEINGMVGGLLDINDQAVNQRYEKNYYQGSKAEAQLWSESDDLRDIQYLVYKVAGEEVMEYKGTSGDNIIYPRENQFYQHKMYSGDGEDALLNVGDNMLFDIELYDLNLSDDYIGTSLSYKSLLAIREESDQLIVSFGSRDTVKIYNLNSLDRQVAIIRFEQFLSDGESINFKII